MKKEEVIEILESKIEIYRTAIKKHPHLKAYEIEVDENILAYQYAIKVLKEFEGDNDECIETCQEITLLNEQIKKLKQRIEGLEKELEDEKEKHDITGI